MQGLGSLPLLIIAIPQSIAWNEDKGEGNLVTFFLAHSFCCVFLSFLYLGMHENLVWQLWLPSYYLSIHMLVNMSLLLVGWCLMLLGKERKAWAVRPFWVLLFKCFLGSVQFGFRWDLGPPLSVVLVGYLNWNVRGFWYHWLACWEKGPPWPLSVLRVVTFRPFRSQLQICPLGA